MDSDPGPTNSFFISTKQVKPFISYEENGEIKAFRTISMIDDSECIVFSDANFDSDYNFLYGEIRALSFKSNRYHAIKKLIGSDIELSDLSGIELNPETISVLKTGMLGTTLETNFDDRMVQIPYSYGFLNDIVLDDMYPKNKSDKVNDYLMRFAANKKVSDEVFKDIERENTRFKVITVSKYTKVKSA